MCSHHDTDDFPSDLKVDIASKAYQSHILKLIPTEGTLEDDFSSVFTKFSDDYHLNEDEHKQSVGSAVEALAKKGQINFSKEDNIYKISITDVGEVKRKSFVSKVLSVFSN